MLLGAVAVMLVMTAGVAVAISKTCDDIPCKGTDKDDQLHERIGNHKKDRILGLQGEDLLDANNYRNDRDRTEGGPQGDDLLTNDGDGRDSAQGGKGSDRCFIDAGDNASSCSVRIQTAGVDP